MKNSFFVLPFLMLFVACQSDQTSEQNIDEQTSLKEEVCIDVFTATLDNSSRTTLDESGRVSLWNATDKIAVRTESATSAEGTVFSIASGAGTNTATFGGSLQVSTPSKIYAIYPRPARFSTTAPTTKAYFTIATTQYQSDKYDIGENDYRTATTSVLAGSTTSLNLHFKPVVALVGIVVDLSQDYPTDRIESIAMTASGKSLSGDFSLNLASTEIDLTVENASSSVTLSLTERPMASQMVEATMVVAPCDLSNASLLLFTVTTDRRTLTFDRTVSKDILSGHKYTLYLSTSNDVFDSSVLSLQPSATNYTARVTGATEQGETLLNPNATDIRFSLAMTDYGVMWDAGNGTVLSAFGDNFDNLSASAGWRSNVLAVSSDRDLSDGLYFSDMIMENGSRKELFDPDSDPDGSSVTYIPSTGVSVGQRQYLLFSHIDTNDGDDDADSWNSNYSEILYSDDFGQNWTQSNVQWSGRGNFVQCSYLRSGGFVYVYGVPAGRYGSVRLARVPEQSMLQKSTYKYWNGNGWSGNESDAVNITEGPASELTVFYNSYYKRYVMMYLSVSRRAIVMRNALQPAGDWSGEEIVIADNGEGLYGPSVHPWTTNGQDIYFVVSHARPYMQAGSNVNRWNVFLMKTTLTPNTAGFNLLCEGGFEDYPEQSLDYKSFWYVPRPSYGAIEAEHTLVHNGTTAMKIVNPSIDGGTNWTGIFQSVAVRQNTDYVLSCWARSRFDNSGALWLGVRDNDGNEIGVTHPILSNSRWTRVSHEFNSGANTTVKPFVNTSGFTTQDSYDLWIYVDDITVRPKTDR